MDTRENVKLGENIKKLRLSKKLSRKALADKIGVSEVTITRYENNDREPNLNTLKKISDVLGVHVAKIFYPNCSITPSSPVVIEEHPHYLELVNAFKTITAYSTSNLNQELDSLTHQQIDELKKLVSDYIEFQIGKNFNNK